MAEIEKLIDNKDYMEIEKWIHSIDSIEKLNSLDPNWLFVAEKINSNAFHQSSCDFEMAKLGVTLYETIYRNDKSQESALFSSLYLRLRVIKNCKLEDKIDFFSPEIIVSYIREKIDMQFEEVEELAQQWKSLEIEQIKKLRSFKNWLNLLHDLEEITEIEYQEFNDWKSLKSMLP